MTQKLSLIQKILDTGWQSWSVGNKKSLLSLKRDFNPLKDEYELPELSYKNIKLKKTIIGWCSWYAFGWNINHKKIIEMAQWFKENKMDIPVNYILIDDGWSKWGDWDSPIKSKFAKGMKDVSDDIHNLGFKSGIWIAPFLVEEDSEVYKNHSDWLVKKNDKLVNGLNWTFFDDLYFKRYLLDIHKSEVKKYIYNLVDILVKKYGFDLIKLDFLYSIYFIPDISSNEAGNFIRQLFKYIKSKYKDVYTIACGSPLIPVVGVVDSVRIGPDTISPHLDRIPIISKIYHNMRIKNVLSSIKVRKFTSMYWNIDPDVFVCRDSIGVDGKIIDDLFQSIKSLKGNIFLGDDMTKLPKEKIDKYIKPLFTK